MRVQSSTLLTVFPALASAIAAPALSGFNIVWSEDFDGPAGAPPNSDIWNIAEAINTNNELQTYTAGNTNLQLSGGQTIQMIPRKTPSGGWTSGRIESKASFTPTPGKVMIIQSEFRFGDNAAANKQGMWPAFWTLGDAIRHGTEWPQCGEVDIFEQVNGVMTGYGSLHCGTSSGGPCNEPNGRHATVAIPDNDFHTWAVKFDLTNDNWEAQTIQWLLDGQVYGTTAGSDIGDQSIFATLAHSPLYILMNVAVGGDWPGSPNDATLDGYGSMMEVKYVGVYST